LRIVANHRIEMMEIAEETADSSDISLTAPLPPDTVESAAPTIVENHRDWLICEPRIINQNKMLLLLHRLMYL